MKKKLMFYPCRRDKSLCKLVRIMKLTVIIILVTLMQVSASVYSQTKLLNLKIDNTSIESVLKEIENQSEFFFLYNNKQIDVTKKIDIDVANKTIEDVLETMLKETGIHYLIKDRQIVLYNGDVNSIIDAIGKSQIVQQQQKTVSGKVTDAKGAPLPGVTVVIKGTTNGTVTNADGEYSLTNISEDAILQFSFVGMKTQEFPVIGKAKINVIMEEETIGLDEVVAVGYGTMKKSDLTGSVSNVDNAALEAVPTYNPVKALKGRASGVEIKQNSGNPSSRIEVRIRGANSMIGSNDPLYVVDGVPLLGGIDYLSPTDIKTMDILKDASSTAIYGARGANGVIIITTKQAIKGQKDKVNIDSYYGLQKEVERYDVLDAKNYAIIVNEWLKNEGSEPYFNPDNVTNPGTDWQKEIFKVAPVQNHWISFSGSTNKTSFLISGNFYSQDGIVKNTSVKKGSIKLSLNHELTHGIKISENIIVTRRESHNTLVDNGFMGKTTLSGALSAPPTLTVYDENGLPTQIETAYFFGAVDMKNPLLFLSPYKDRSLLDKILANSAFEFNIIDKLTFKTLLGAEFSHNINDNFTPKVYPEDRGFASDGYSFENSFVNENTLTFNKRIGENHSLNVVGGFTYQKFMERGENASVEDITTNITENYDLSGATTINIPSNYYSEWTLLSWLGRVNYSFKGKYLLTASIRSDGSSRFGVNNKWGIFPSGAIGWRVSDESFMKNISQISHLKLRASFGVTGNTALRPYQSLSRLITTNYIVSNKEIRVGYAPSGVSNSDLKWETTNQTDIGFDMTLFNKLFITFDYYKKVTSNLLASVPLPPSIGFSSTLDNLGKIQNKGLELSIDADVIDKELNWHIVGNISANRNKVLELSKGSDIESGGLGLPFNSATNIIREGQPLGMFFGYEEDGLDENGYIKYRDNKEDGSITAEDRVIIGNPYPDFIYSITNNLSYKNFDLNIFIDASQGNDLFWATAGTHLNSFQRGQNQFVDLIGNYWTTENPDPNAKYPKISSSSGFQVSDRYIKDGSYIRLKIFTLGYSLPIEKLGISWCSKARFYISGTNLFTITKYPGLDPESNTVGTDSQTVTDRARIGIDQSAYPSAKSIVIGCSLSF